METWGITNLEHSRVYLADLITGKVHINHHQRNAIYHVDNSTREK